jgi:hypothetical protein
MKRTESAMARSVGEELVILDPSTGKYFGLNAVGALIWDHLANECSRDDLVAAVIADYDVTTDQAGKDVDDLIGQFRDAELIAP